MARAKGTESRLYTHSTRARELNSTQIEQRTFDGTPIQLNSVTRARTHNCTLASPLLAELEERLASDAPLHAQCIALALTAQRRALALEAVSAGAAEDGATISSLRARVAAAEGKVAVHRAREGLAVAALGVEQRAGAAAGSRIAELEAQLREVHELLLANGAAAAAAARCAGVTNTAAAGGGAVAAMRVRPPHLRQ